MPQVIRTAQYGTKHGHAAGKLQAMLKNPNVEVAGVYEPDSERRRQLAREEGAYQNVRWFADEEEMLRDETIALIASEGLNVESLDHTEQCIGAGKHVWYDKPAGEDWPQWQRVVAMAREKDLLLQMGYMFRYHEGFRLISDWATSGLLGDVFSIRAHMSTHISEASRRAISVHRGGICYDLAGHMIDQIVWLLGRPKRVSSILRNHSGVVAPFADNTLAILEYDSAIAFIDIAAMEPRPMARRFEVYGNEGSAILMEPFEPAQSIRLCLERAQDGFSQGAQVVPVTPQSRQSLYELELEAILATIANQKLPDRPPEHELLVHETLLRATGAIPGNKG